MLYTCTPRHLGTSTSLSQLLLMSRRAAFPDIGIKHLNSHSLRRSRRSTARKTSMMMRDVQVRLRKKNDSSEEKVESAFIRSRVHESHAPQMNTSLTIDIHFQKPKGHKSKTMKNLNNENPRFRFPNFRFK